MSRLLKALATIESKGATLTFPRELSPQRPKRRTEGPRPDLTLATLEAYLRSALDADTSATLAAEPTDSVALCCLTGLAGPWIEPVEAIQQLFDATGEVSDTWAAREDGPPARMALVDRELPCEALVEPEEAAPDGLAALDSEDWLIVPAEDVVTAAELEYSQWRDELLDELPPPATVEPEIVSEVVEGVVDEVAPNVADEETIARALATLLIDIDEDLAAWTDGVDALPAAAESVAIAAPSELPGWPDELPAALAVDDDVEVEVDLDPLRLQVAPERSGWLTEYELSPAEPHGQLAVACPDWAAVDAAQAAAVSEPEYLAAILLEEVNDAPARSIEPPPVLRRRLTSRELLPAEEAWNECRAIADGLLGAWNGQPAAWLFVELGANALRTPIVAPLAAMLAESISGRMLLIDTDCRPPYDWQALGDIAPYGFADIARRAADWPKFVHNSAVARLDLIPAGLREASSTQLNEFAAGAWLTALEREYDLVLLHSTWPSATGIASLADAATATYLVTPLGTDEAEAQEAIGQLRSWGARVEGCVVVEEEDEKVRR